MNQIRRFNREADERALIENVVRQQSWPAFVTGFDMKFADMDGDPAVWVSVKLVHDLTPDDPRTEPWIDAMNALTRATPDDLFSQNPERFPYFSFDVSEATAQA